VNLLVCKENCRFDGVSGWRDVLLSWTMGKYDVGPVSAVPFWEIKRAEHCLVASVSDLGGEVEESKGLGWDGRHGEVLGECRFGVE
jgi:hypothetical protein